MHPSCWSNSMLIVKLLFWLLSFWLISHHHELLLEKLVKRTDGYMIVANSCSIYSEVSPINFVWKWNEHIGEYAYQIHIAKKWTCKSSKRCGKGERAIILMGQYGRDYSLSNHQSSNVTDNILPNQSQIFIIQFLPASMQPWRFNV